MSKILGIDLGTGSIGLALRNPEAGDSVLEQLEYFCSDIYQAGVGKDRTGEYSLAAERTSHRQSRRLKETRRRRLWATLQLLIDYHLCPMSQSSLDQWKTYNKSKDLYRIYPINDAAFANWIKMDFDSDGVPDYSSPYQLRKELVTIQFDFTNQTNLFKLGRALYHIAQRRGFKSSKGETISSQETESKESVDYSDKDISAEMQKSETKLSQEITNYMTEHGCHTVGEAFAVLEDEGVRIRNSRYVTVRKQLEEEIKYIFDFQKGLSVDSDLYTRLTSKKKNIGTIFYKKPLRSQKWLVGKCTLENNKTRCPISHPEYEKFRALCFLNNIKYRKDSLSEWESLPIEVKQILFEALFSKRVKADFPFKEIREKAQTLLHVSLNGDCEKEHRTINYKDKQSVPGCPVIARMRNLLGDDWETFNMEGKKQRTSHSKNNINSHIVKYTALDLWHICYETDNPEYLTEFAHQQLGWDDKQTKKFVRLWSTQAQGYAMLSLKAIRNINRMLLAGLKYSDAVLLAKVPDIVRLSETELQELISDYDFTIKKSVDNEKVILGIVNSLIAQYKSLDTRSKFAFHDCEYKLQDTDYKDIQKQICNTIGNKTWELMDKEEQESIYHQVCHKYQDFFYNFKRDFYRLPHLADTLKDYLTKRFPAIETSQWEKLYHPSLISLYNVERTGTDKAELRLGSPSIGAMRNPVARRTLNILRKKINAMLDAGLIDIDDTRIVIETTRQFNDANMRWAIEAYQRERENENKAIRELLQELYPNRDINESDVDSARYAIEQPIETDGRKNSEEQLENLNKYKENKNRTYGIDVTKYRLWKEQKCLCIYTGKMISITQLFNENSFDIEHTIPRSISFDCSDKNLTICDSFYNRSIKKNLIPTQLPNYEKNAVINGVEYTAIKPRLQPWIKRVEQLKDNVEFWKAQSRRAMEKNRKDYCIRQKHLWQMELDYWKAKVERFTMTEVKEEFRNSQLIDTGIITKYATLYLKSIFNNVDVQKGTATAEFRKMLGIQSVDEKKDRSLHSHHAIDATILTLIPVAAKRQRMLKLFYDIEEAERFGHDSQYMRRILNQEITECNFGQNISQVPQYIEEHIIIKHHTTDRTFSSIHTITGYNKHMPGGDSVRGRLHKETFYGAIQLPCESGTGLDRKFITSKGKFVYPDKPSITIVTNVDITSFASEKDFETIIDFHVRDSINKTIKKRLMDGLSFKEAINRPIWMLDKEGNEIKTNKNGKMLCPIRHVRCKVKAGRGYMTREKSLEIRQHINISTKKSINISDKSYKQKVYAQNDTNYLYLLYEGIKKGHVDRKSRIISLWEATMLHGNNDIEIDQLIRDTLDYNRIVEKSIEYKLSAIIRVGDYVLIWNENPDELKELDKAEISKRLYVVVKFNTTGADLLFLKKHLSANVEPDLNLVANKVNCLIEHRDFEIDTLGNITFND